MLTQLIKFFQRNKPFLRFNRSTLVHVHCKMYYYFVVVEPDWEYYSSWGEIKEHIESMALGLLNYPEYDYLGVETRHEWLNVEDV